MFTAVDPPTYILASLFAALMLTVRFILSIASTRERSH